MRMAKRFTISTLVILFAFSNLIFAQTESPYSGFSPEKIKENTKYARNFAPNNYDSKVLYDCMTEILDSARAQYRYLPAMKHDIRLDSTAQFQADYMGSKDERTEENLAPYKTIPYRLRKYGLAGNGQELVTKTKAYLGEAEYSYYDLCLSAVLNLLKNAKLVDILLDRQYSYVGIGFNTDIMMRNMYISFVLGNDRTFNNYKPAIGAKDLPYSKGQSGLKPFDSKICKKCATETGLETLSEYMSINKNGDVYITCDDYKAVKKLIGKEGDAIALDFVQQSQYDCEGFTIDYDHPHRGFVTKPITFESILEKNENTNLKTGKLIAKIATLPEAIELSAPVELHILILKEGNRVCRTIIPKYIETKNADYTEKINFIEDKSGSVGEWVPTAETDSFSVEFPYTLKKTDYTCAAFDSALKAIDVPEYNINRIEIIAHNSPNYYKDAVYQKTQQKRADFLKKNMQTRYPGTEITVRYDFCWDLFKEKIVNQSDYYDLSFLTLDEAARQLKGDSYALKALDSGYLAPCRYYEIKFHVTYPIGNKEQEQAFTLWKFNGAIANKNKKLASSIEKYIASQVREGSYTASTVSKMRIPWTKNYQALLNNKMYMLYYLAPRMTKQLKDSITRVSNLDATNQTVFFNTTVADVALSSIKTPADVSQIQAKIDKLYTMPTVQKTYVDALNLEHQLNIINFTDTAAKTTETVALSAAAYSKVKSLQNPKMDTWRNAYKKASYFVKNHDYTYAISLMEPFLDEETVSEDFLMSYVSIAAHREQTYLSPLFTKAVKRAFEKNPARLCGIFGKLPYCVMENEEVKSILCKNCDR